MSDPASDSRRLLGLVAYLARQESTRFEDLDFSHPLLSGSTMGEIRAALDELARRSTDELCAQYGIWIGAKDGMAVGASSETDWMPLVKLRYQNLQHRNQIAGRGAIVWSPADCWLVHYIQHSMSLSHRKLGYAIYSIISKEPAQYFFAVTRPSLDDDNHCGIWKMNQTAETRTLFPDTRPINAALSERLLTIIEANIGDRLSAASPDMPLHNYIKTNFVT